ncbi:hypothetical protein Dda_6442 [Drechslerella dactyloides]|uniref:FAD-binding FR-type domain-containing protein n=1 Tax=Drechslerella dactyloides TaxID=74499 RepID=A0AAD6IXU4_DREDA|nr:hypothetical protein Dda_6442 [Drechslerella dactyloides]
MRRICPAVSGNVANSSAAFVIVPVTTSAVVPFAVAMMASRIASGAGFTCAVDIGVGRRYMGDTVNVRRMDSRPHKRLLRAGEYRHISTPDVMWRIGTATPDEKALRRSALDFFGLFTLFTTVFAAVVVCVCTAAYRAAFTDGGRRVYLADWWLSQRVWTLSRRRWVFSFIFIVITAILVTLGTGDDYFHLTKRLSHTAAALLPAQYALSSRFLLQRASTLTFRTHETLNAVHRFLGRAIYALLSLHAGLYLYYIARYKPGRLLYMDAVFGLLGYGVMSAVFITSLPVFRRRYYTRFQNAHQVLTILVLPVAWFHVPYVRRYVFVAGCIVVGERVGRYLSTISTTLRARYVSPTALELQIDGGEMVSAGEHYYVYAGGGRGNPFTAVNTRFLVRVRGTVTRALAAAEGSIPAKLEGPYGIAGVFPTTFDGYLFIAGGVGVTTTIAVLRSLVHRTEREEGMGRRVRFVWAVRGVEEAAWPVDELKTITRVKPSVDIYVTGHTTNMDDGVEMDEMGAAHDHLLEEERGGDVRTVEELRRLYARTPACIKRGRPDVGGVAGEFCRSGGRVAVVVCGPEGMAGDVRRGIYARGGHLHSLVWLWEESFSL